ncbi:hypothetical protein EAX61_07400 [Dokdonia sinensis]|uniref:CBM-cenC domain-containing protein n=1 Tax=Dokdonia sinensis TaxID=2479847 RepID=A0A3M0G5N6_9FLAO|nr:hypothetical protein [Dokdonia sinensis]RMB59407.1 hypothetical protein EAX61_07400 [Dokdonia sinensis]
MKIIRTYKRISLLYVLLAIVSCEDNLQEFPLLTTVPCEDTDVVVDPLIISDFECQANIEIANVTTVRNPTETGINTSLFVGQFIDGQSATDGITINYGTINLSENALFKFKVKSDVTGALVVRLLGGNGATAVISSTVFGGDAWTQQELDFSDFEDGDFDQIMIIFNEGVETNGDDIYFIDDILFDKAIDPCEDVQPDLSIINDFECQQNYLLGDPSQGESAVVVVPNPSASGINVSPFVGEYIDNGTEPFDNLLIDFQEVVDLMENSQFSIKVRSGIAGQVIAKLEGGLMPLERTATIQQTNQWSELTFDFRDAQGAENTRLVLFFNAGATNGTETDSYFIDDLRFIPFAEECEGVTPDLSIISDFECQQNYQLDAVPAVDNPNMTALNMSAMVGRYVDNGTEPFDSIIINFGGPIDLSENAQLNIKVLSSMQAPLLAKLEGGTGAPTEIATTINVVDEWSNYTFDFSSAIDDGNTVLVLFFNAGQSDGTTEDIYFIDDLQFQNAGCNQIVENCDGVDEDLSIINDFDCQQNFPFANAGDIPTVQNPMVTCDNRSSNVGQYTDNGTDPFDNTLINFGAPIDLSVNNQFKIKVLSTEAGPILAKLEGGTPVEIFADITVLNEWVEYTFDFSGAEGNGNTALVLFFNATETDGTPQDLYYIDDLRFEAQ